MSGFGPSPSDSLATLAVIALGGVWLWRRFKEVQRSANWIEMVAWLAVFAVYVFFVLEYLSIF